MDSACAILNDHCISSRRFFLLYRMIPEKREREKHALNASEFPPVKHCTMIDR